MKQTKRFTLLFALILLVGAVYPIDSLAKHDDIKIWIDGDYVETDVSPIIENGRTLVPIRVIAEHLGRNVTWYEPEKRINIGEPGDSGSGNGIFMWLGNKTAYIGEEFEVQLEVAPKTVKGRTMVPIRFIAEALDYKVSWDQKNRTVKLEYDSDYIINLIDEVIFSTNNEIVKRVKKGQSIRYDLYRDLIEGYICYGISIGDNFEDRFVAHEHYFISIDAKLIYKYDVVTDTYQLIK